MIQEGRPYLAGLNQQFPSHFLAPQARMQLDSIGLNHTKVEGQLPATSWLPGQEQANFATSLSR